MSKKVFVVRGSEDGTIAVCTNRKKVHEVAKDYFENSWEDSDPKILTINGDFPLNYNNVCRAMLGTWGFRVKAGQIEIDVEVFRLNKY